MRDRASVERWVESLVSRGGGRIDADILRDAYRAAAAADITALDGANRRGLVYRATAELLIETASQGAAFLATCRAAWPDVFLDGWAQATKSVCYPAAVGAAAARSGMPLEAALLAYLETMAANLVAAALRLGLAGQTDGQRIMAALESPVVAAAGASIFRDPARFGAASFAADLASMAHETQYSRLFRS